MHPTIRIVPALLAGALAARPAAAQEAPIQDNSFLLEEAYNQDSGVVQHVGTLERAFDGDGWVFAFTQEWPVIDRSHQFSFSVPVVDAGSGVGVGDVSVDYRYQLLGGGDAPVSIAPRVSLLLATGDQASGRGDGRMGAEIGIPMSRVLTPSLVAHTNAALAVLLQARSEVGPRAATLQTTLGQSVVWLAHPRLNVLVEGLWEAQRGEDGVGDTESLFISPGVRGAFDVGRVQVVPGIAVPIGVGESSGERSLFLYLSLEHSFRR
jgi:hypothetical protein